MRELVCQTFSHYLMTEFDEPWLQASLYSAYPMLIDLIEICVHQRRQMSVKTDALKSHFRP